MLGKTIKELGVSEVSCPYYSVKEAKLPFERFPGADVLLSPEMKSTGESMGIDNDFSIAVCLNAAAGLLVAEKSNSFNEGYQELRKHILSGKVINHISKFSK